MYAFLINKTTKHQEKIKKRIFYLNNLLNASTFVPIGGRIGPFLCDWWWLATKKLRKICKKQKNALSLQRFWDDESQRLGLSYGVMVALQFLVLPVLVRIRVRQLTGRSDFRIAPFCLCLVGGLATLSGHLYKSSLRGPLCVLSLLDFVCREIGLPQRILLYPKFIANLQ